MNEITSIANEIIKNAKGETVKEISQITSSNFNQLVKAAQDFMKELKTKNADFSKKRMSKTAYIQMLRSQNQNSLITEQEISNITQKVSDEKQENKFKKDIITITMAFQQAVNKILKQKINLTWVVETKDEQGHVKQEIIVFDEAEEIEILANGIANPSGRIVLNPANLIKLRENGIVKGKNIENFLLEALGEKNNKKNVENHIKLLKNLYHFIQEDKRLVRTEKINNSNKTTYYYLWLWWNENNLRTYAQVGNYGIFNEGYVAALANIPKEKQYSPFSMLNEEDKIKKLYEDYILKVDNLAGLWGGDVDVNIEENLQLAVKAGRASSQSFGLLYDFASWLVNNKTLTKEIQEKGIYASFYEDKQKKIDLFRAKKGLQKTSFKQGQVINLISDTISKSAKESLEHFLQETTKNLNGVKYYNNI